MPYRKKQEPFPKPPKITDAEYYRMLKEQHGGCAICGRPPRTRRLALDHCHQTGVVRGLLCLGKSGCNYMLGVWDDNASRFERAAWYLRRKQSA